MSELNLNLWTIAGYIVGSDLPPQYEFIQAFVCVFLICIFMCVILSPFLIIRLFCDK